MGNISSRILKVLHKLTGAENLRVDDLIIFGLLRGQANSQNRIISASNPSSWEFSGFSQNNEDGIIDFLSRNMITHNNYFIEIGAGNGLENNSAWLAFSRKWSGIMIDGDSNNVRFCRKLVVKAQRVCCRELFVTLDNIGELFEYFDTFQPDLFSLDIDGNDYHIMKEMFIKGFRPGIAVVEYNSALGPDKKLALRYDKNFRYSIPLNFGTSIQAWRKLFSEFNYKFITTDSNGINAIFVNPSVFKSDFLDCIDGSSFYENLYMLRIYKKGWEHQINLINDELFIKVD